MVQQLWKLILIIDSEVLVNTVSVTAIHTKNVLKSCHKKYPDNTDP